MDADVAVIGLGAMGSMAAWRLAKRGAAVIGFDQFDPPHERGSSQGQSRIFRLAAYEGAFYVPIVAAASALWDELGAHTGNPMLVRTGLLAIAAAGDPQREVTRQGLRAHRLPFEEFGAAEATRRFPAHRFAFDDMCLLDPAAGIILPEHAIRTALDVAGAHDAVFHRNTRVDDIRFSGERVEIRAGDESYAVRHVVNATGGWIGELLPVLRPHVTVERQVQVWLDLADPAFVTPERFPVFIRHLSGNRVRYGFPSLDGKTIKLAAHHGGIVSAHPDAVDRRVTTADTDVVVRFAAEGLRGVTANVARTAICFYPNAPDEHFVVGQVPGMPWQTMAQPRVMDSSLPPRSGTSPPTSPSPAALNCPSPRSIRCGCSDNLSPVAAGDGDRRRDARSGASDWPGPRGWRKGPAWRCVPR